MQWQPPTPELAAFYTSPSSSTPPPLFGVIIPGNPVQTNISPVDAGRWTISLGVAPESFVVFLTMSEPLPPCYGVGLFLAREDTMGFQYVGSLTRERASAIVKVPAIFLSPAQPIHIVLGLALEREEELQNLGRTREQPLYQSEAATKIAIAERILEDLYSFVLSYARSLTPGSDCSIGDLSSSEGGDYVLMPASFMDKWRSRVHKKITKDDAFWL